MIDNHETLDTHRRLPSPISGDNAFEAVQSYGWMRRSTDSMFDLYQHGERITREYFSSSC